MQPFIKPFAVILLVLPLGRSRDALNMTNIDLLYKSNWEVFENVPITLENSFPTWLKGDLIFNGMRAFEIEDQYFNSLFDAFSGLTRIHLEGDNSTYSAKVFESVYNTKAKKDGALPRILTFGGTVPLSKPKATDLIQWVVSNEPIMSDADNLNVAICKYKDKFFTTSDWNSLNEFNISNLNYVSRKDSWGTDDPYSFTTLSSAHPKPHPTKPGLINFSVKMDIPGMIIPGRNYRPSFQFWHAQDAEEGIREPIGEIFSDRVSFVHSFSVTTNYIILFEFPMVYNLGEMLKAQGPVKDFLKWMPERDTKVTVMRIDTGEIVKTFTDNTLLRFSMHQFNAYETSDDDDNNIVIDMTVYDTGKDIFKMFDMDQLRSNPSDDFACGKLMRVTLPMEEGETEISAVTLADCVDLASVPSEVMYRPYRYLYGMNAYESGNTINSLAKVDAKRRKKRVWAQDNCYPAEPHFVPRPGAKKEDDGVVLSIVLDGIKKQSFLLVLDAKSFKEVSRAWLPDRTTYTLHGMYVPN